jgi:hypothetical protein
MVRSAGLVLLAAALGLGCGDGDGDAAPDAMAGVAGNAIAGSVHYDGDGDGALIIGVFTEFPPMSGPVAFHSVPQPTWPETFELSPVPAGTYYAVATLDIGRDNPTMPGPEDLQTPSPPITVSDETGAWVELTLHDH